MSRSLKSRLLRAPVCSFRLLLDSNLLCRTICCREGISLGDLSVALAVLLYRFTLFSINTISLYNIVLLSPFAINRNLGPVYQVLSKHPDSSNYYCVSINKAT